MLYLIFQITWAVFGVLLFSVLFVVAMLWGDKLFNRVTGTGLFELVGEIFRKFAEGRIWQTLTI